MKVANGYGKDQVAVVQGRKELSNVMIDRKVLTTYGSWEFREGTVPKYVVDQVDMDTVIKNDSIVVVFDDF